MATCIENLELTAEEVAAAKEEIRRLAFEKWLEAGQPDGDGVQFWMAAESQWIERLYVPHRPYREAANGR